MDDFEYESGGENWVVDDGGIYVKVPNFQYVYKTVIPREVFIEAFNRYIKNNTSSDIQE